MNKYRKEKSRRIKMHIKLSEIFHGRIPSYKDAKREVRAYERYVKEFKNKLAWEMRYLGKFNIKEASE